MDLEVTRKAVHAAVAILAVPALLLAPIWVAVGLSAAGVVVVLTTWWIDTRGRREEVPEPMQPLHEAVEVMLEKTMRPDEPFPWAAMYYIGGLQLIALSSTVLEIPLSFAFAAYAVLGVGDAASALIGRAYGRHKIWWNRKKSWEGTGAGIVAGFPAALVLAGAFYWFAGAVYPPALAPVILLGTIGGMVFESLPRLEDNFAVPVGAWLVMLAAGRAVGVL